MINCSYIASEDTVWWQHRFNLNVIRIIYYLCLKFINNYFWYFVWLLGVFYWRKKNLLTLTLLWVTCKTWPFIFFFKMGHLLFFRYSGKCIPNEKNRNKVKIKNLCGLTFFWRTNLLKYFWCWFQISVKFLEEFFTIHIHTCNCVFFFLANRQLIYKRKDPSYWWISVGQIKYIQ